MINAKMREYDYYTLGEKNAYGQQTITAEKQGTVRMAVYTTSQSIQDNILYQGCSYMAITHDTGVNDAYVIDFNGERLKVLYISQQGRLRQVFLQRMT